MLHYVWIKFLEQTIMIQIKWIIFSSCTRNNFLINMYISIIYFKWRLCCRNGVLQRFACIIFNVCVLSASMVVFSKLLIFRNLYRLTGSLFNKIDELALQRYDVLVVTFVPMGFIESVLGDNYTVTYQLKYYILFPIAIYISYSIFS